MCRTAYGPWSPPAPTPGHSELEYEHVYEQPGTYVARFEEKSQTYNDGALYAQPGPGDKEGSCLQPYASADETEVIIEVSP